MDRYIGRWMDRYIDRWRCGGLKRLNSYIDRWMDGSRWMDGWIERWMDGQTGVVTLRERRKSACLFSLHIKM